MNTEFFVLSTSSTVHPLRRVWVAIGFGVVIVQPPAFHTMR